MADEKTDAFPRDDLVRAISPGFEIRASENPNGMPTLESRFIQYDTFTEIDSAYEGHFMERIAPGALKKTLAENRDQIKVLLEHGNDPTVGNKPLGAIQEIRDEGGHAVGIVPLLDTSYVRDLIPALQEGLYGSSFRFRVIKEDVVRQPERSASNPDGLPERTITELRLYEFGPVLFPAYEGATAGVRSLTDQFREQRSPLTSADAPSSLVSEPATAATPVPVKDDEPEEHSPEASRDATPEPDKPVTTSEATEETMSEYRSVEEIDARLSEIDEKLVEISAEHGVRALPSDAKASWDELKDEKERLSADKTDYLERQAYLEAQSKRDSARVAGAGSAVAVANRSKAPENVFDMTEYHTRSSSQEHMNRLLEEGAKRAIDTFHYPNPNVNQADTSEKVERLLAQDGPDKEIAQRLLVHGSPTYRSAFWKTLGKQPLNADEQRAMAQGMQLEARAITTSQTGGVTVPVQIDPTVLLSSSGAINPFRQVAKIVQTTSNQWQGVTSAGITAAFAAEGAVMADNSPSLVSPTINPERANAFVPYSWEAGQDWGALETDMAAMFADAKDVLEATKFASGAGHGSNEPQGVLSGAGTVVGTNATTVVGTVDIYALEQALPVRFQPNAVWLATPALFARIRQLAPGAQYGIWADSLQVGQPARLLGYPAYKASTVGTAGGNVVNVASTKWGIFGDFSKFAIVDRIGFQVKHIETLFNGNTAGGIAYPNGQSGVVCYWRTSSGVLASNAFRTGTTT